MADKRSKQPTDEEIKAKAISRWEGEGGAPVDRKPKRPRDLNQWAKRMVDIATGEVEDREPPPPKSKAERASKGGTARATALKPKRRTEIAKKAAAARWAKRHESSDA